VKVLFRGHSLAGLENATTDPIAKKAGKLPIRSPSAIRGNHTPTLGADIRSTSGVCV
jgi:hypothetical protein